MHFLTRWYPVAHTPLNTDIARRSSHRLTYGRLRSSFATLDTSPCSRTSTTRLRSVAATHSSACDTVVLLQHDAVIAPAMLLLGQPTCQYAHVIVLEEVTLLMTVRMRTPDVCTSCAHISDDMTYPVSSSGQLWLIPILQYTTTPV